MCQKHHFEMYYDVHFSIIHLIKSHNEIEKNVFLIILNFYLFNYLINYSLLEDESLSVEKSTYTLNLCP